MFGYVEIDTSDFLINAVGDASAELDSISSWVKGHNCIIEMLGNAVKVILNVLSDSSNIYLSVQRLYVSNSNYCGL